MISRSRPYLDPIAVFRILESDVDEFGGEHFRRAFQRRIGAKACWLTHQGRDALTILFRAIRLSPGDEVIIPNLICSIVVDTILSFRAIPVLVDINADDFNLSVLDVEAKITSKTRAIIALHLYGIPCDISRLKHVAERHQCVLIEDCAQSVNSTVDGQPVGLFGDFSIFSFNFDKPISLGRGGALVVNNEDHIEEVKKCMNKIEPVPVDEELSILRELLLQFYLTDSKQYHRFLPTDFSHGLFQIRWIRNIVYTAIEDRNLEALHPIVTKLNWISKYQKFRRHLWPGSEESTYSPRRMNFIRASLGLTQLESLKEIQKIRNDHAQAYHTQLAGSPLISLPTIGEKNAVNYLKFTICSKHSISRKTLVGSAGEIGIEVDFNNWQYVISEQYQNKKRVKVDPSSLLSSTSKVKEILHLPVHQDVSEAKRNDLIDLLT